MWWCKLLTYCVYSESRLDWSSFYINSPFCTEKCNTTFHIKYKRKGRKTFILWFSLFGSKSKAIAATKIMKIDMWINSANIVCLSILQLLKIYCEENQENYIIEKKFYTYKYMYMMTEHNIYFIFCSNLYCPSRKMIKS